jgi:hypothetical protein
MFGNSYLSLVPRFGVFGSFEARKQDPALAGIAFRVPGNRPYVVYSPMLWGGPRRCCEGLVAPRKFA